MKISRNGFFTVPRQLPRNFVHAGGLHVRNILRTLSHSPGGNNVVAGIDVAVVETVVDVWLCWRASGMNQVPRR
jgi:hypothetical protein